MADPATFPALWERLDAIRAERGLSYRGLALQINQIDGRRRISQSTVHDRMTSGRRVGWPELRLVVLALGQGEEPWLRLWKRADLAHRIVERKAAAQDSGVAVVARAQLPADIGEFTGRERECAQVYQIHAPGAESATAMAVSVIEGMAGVGKTRLAIHVAHMLRPHHGDVQLYYDLRGHSPHQEPAGPGEVLEALLPLLGVPGAQIPRDLHTRAALYRDRLNGLRAVVLLDNAAGAEQVRPLLPGSPTCQVIITSRRTLALDGVESITLDVFSPAEAITLLNRIVGSDRVRREPDAAAEIVRRCGYLPLAVALLGRRLRARRSWTLADLGRRLAAQEQRLSELKVSDRAVRGVFDLSYHHLPGAHRRLFRRLGLHPGLDFTPESAAALDGITPDEAEAVLEALLDEHLLQQTVPGRFQFHDLLREYARECAAGDEAATERAGAVRRVLHWYLLRVDAADRVMAPHRRRHDGPDRREAPQWLRDFRDRRHAIDWCESERANLVAAIRLAADRGLDTIAWQLPCALYTFFHLRAYRADWIATHNVALSTVERIADPAAEARVRAGLGIAYVEIGRLDDAVECLERTLAIRRRLGDRVLTADALNNLGEAYRRCGRYAEAVLCYEQDLAVCREIGDRHAQAISLNNLGKAYHELGRLPEALEYHHQALAACREVGDRYVEGEIFNDLGETCHHAGRHAEAVSHYRRALDIRQALGDRLGTARTGASLGDALQASGQAREAAVRWRCALEILEQLGDPLATQIRERLDGRP